MHACGRPGWVRAVLRCAAHWVLCIGTLLFASAPQAKLDSALHVALRHPQRPLRLHSCEPHASKHLQRRRRHVLLLLGLLAATPLLLHLLLAWSLLLLLLCLAVKHLLLAQP